MQVPKGTPHWTSFDVEQFKEAWKENEPWKEKTGMCDGNHDVQVPSYTLEVYMSRGSVLEICHELSEDESQPFGHFSDMFFGSCFTLIFQEKGIRFFFFYLNIPPQWHPTLLDFGIQI